jgi:mevalonate kinase
MPTYRSHGKLLLTAEYVVLKGASALAIPCSLGQTLRYNPSKSTTLIWRSLAVDGSLWFQVEFDYHTLELKKSTDLIIWEKLEKIIRVAKSLNPSFLDEGGSVVTQLEFDRKWGLGSSSTLISNIALWAQINPYELLDQSFGGSGYDVACARAKTPILFIKDNYHPKINQVEFSPPFKKNLFFVYLNQKKNSQEAIASFDFNSVSQSITDKINEITNEIILCTNQNEFNLLLKAHESIIGGLLNQKPIQEILFPDFDGAIKSLGAWGGDFILASGAQQSIAYFKNKGFQTIFSFEKMIL